MNRFFEPGDITFIIVPSCRGGTLVLKNLWSTVDRRLSTVVPTVQVSDTTMLHSITEARFQKHFFFILEPVTNRQ